MMIMGNRTTLALNQLAIDLGMESAVSYIHYALPRLIERHDKLIQLLTQKNWKDASALAHKTLASIRVYGVTSFEPLVKSIEKQLVEEISQVTFQQTLQASFQTLLADIERWLQK